MNNSDIQIGPVERNALAKCPIIEDTVMATIEASDQSPISIDTLVRLKEAGLVIDATPLKSDGQRPMTPTIQWSPSPLARDLMANTGAL